MAVGAAEWTQFTAESRRRARAHTKWPRGRELGAGRCRGGAGAPAVRRSPSARLLLLRRRAARAHTLAAAHWPNKEKEGNSLAHGGAGAGVSISMCSPPYTHAAGPGRLALQASASRAAAGLPASVAPASVCAPSCQHTSQPMEVGSGRQANGFTRTHREREFNLLLHTHSALREAKVELLRPGRTQRTQTLAELTLGNFF